MTALIPEFYIIKSPSSTYAEHVGELVSCGPGGATLQVRSDDGTPRLCSYNWSCLRPLGLRAHLRKFRRSVTPRGR
jgi:hypothetical protein